MGIIRRPHNQVFRPYEPRKEKRRDMCTTDEADVGGTCCPISFLSIPKAKLRQRLILDTLLCDSTTQCCLLRYEQTYLLSVVSFPEALAAVISRADFGALVRPAPDFPTLTSSQSCPLGSCTFGMIIRMNEYCC